MTQLTGVERTKPNTTAVVIVDVQEKLVPSMPPERMEALVRATRILVSAAKEEVAGDQRLAETVFAEG